MYRSSYLCTLCAVAAALTACSSGTLGSTCLETGTCGDAGAQGDSAHHYDGGHGDAVSSGDHATNGDSGAGGDSGPGGDSISGGDSEPGWDPGNPDIPPYDLTGYGTVVHIDPSSSDPSPDGSEAHPFATWSAALQSTGGEAASNTAYLQMRGTTADVSGFSINQKTNLLLGAYGTGERPVMSHVGSGNLITVELSSQLVFRDLEMTADHDDTYSFLVVNNDSHHIEIYSLKNHRAEWALRLMDWRSGVEVSDIVVKGCELFDAQDDCVYIQHGRNIEFAYNNVHHCNQKWFSGASSDAAPGDGLQFHIANDVHVHHNSIDKSTAGNKFAIMIGSVAGALFEHNILVGPIPTSNDLGGTVIYLSGDSSDIVIRYNDLVGDTNFGIWSHMGNLDVYGNVFRQVRSAIHSDGSPPIEIYNNVFYEVGLQSATYNSMPLSGSNMIIRNNIFDLDVEPFNGETASHNLFTDAGLAEGSDNVIAADPMFVDAANGDFHLQSGSPALNQGTSVTTSDGVAVSFDREGTAIPQGAAPDIGAFEAL